jgi:hypothetical protein
MLVSEEVFYKEVYFLKRSNCFIKALFKGFFSLDSLGARKGFGLNCCTSLGLSGLTYLSKE